jgi:hypothetical protein
MALACHHRHRIRQHSQRCRRGITGRRRLRPRQHGETHPVKPSSTPAGAMTAVVVVAALVAVVVSVVVVAKHRRVQTKGALTLAPTQR